MIGALYPRHLKIIIIHRDSSKAAHKATCILIAHLELQHITVVSFPLTEAGSMFKKVEYTRYYSSPGVDVLSMIGFNIGIKLQRITC